MKDFEFHHHRTDHLIDKMDSSITRGLDRDPKSGYDLFVQELCRTNGSVVGKSFGFYPLGQVFCGNHYVLEPMHVTQFQGSHKVQPPSFK